MAFLTNKPTNQLVVVNIGGGVIDRVVQSPCGVIANLLDFDYEVSEFEHQSCFLRSLSDLNSWKKNEPPYPAR